MCDMRSALLRVHAYWMLIGACNPAVMGGFLLAFGCLGGVLLLPVLFRSSVHGALHAHRGASVLERPRVTFDLLLLFGVAVTFIFRLRASEVYWSEKRLGGQPPCRKETRRTTPMSKRDSEYNPHVGKKKKKKRNSRGSVCCLGSVCRLGSVCCLL